MLHGLDVAVLTWHENLIAFPFKLLLFLTYLPVSKSIGHLRIQNQLILGGTGFSFYGQ
jgi:hypothetical protein